MSSSTHSVNQETPAHQGGREVEWQLACTDLGAVRRWLAEHGIIDGLVLEPRPSLELFDTYLDTDDWRIHRAGFALRVRSESGRSEATLKSLRSASTEVADRRELSEMLEIADGTDGDWVRHSNGPVGSRVRAVGGAHGLRPLFEVRTSRQRFAVRRRDETQELGEIALDDTVISRPHGEPAASLQRVEVEALREPHEPLRGLVMTLRREFALEVAADNKYSQGLKSIGLAPGPAPEFAPTTVAATMPMLEVALANLRRYWSVWQVHEPGARLGDDPEELHDLRVAARRLDAVLRQFRPSLPESLLKIGPTLKKVLRALGDARDLDVALSELETFSRELAPAERETVQPLKRHLASERDRARTRMLHVLDLPSVQGKLQALTLLLGAPSEPSQASAADSARNWAPGLIRRRYRKLRKAADHLKADASMEAYHELRGQVKKLRYALEAVAVIFGTPADEMLRSLRNWQDKLGVQQDAAVGSRRLKALAVAPPPGMTPQTLFLMGRLAEHYVSVGARARQVHAKGYRKLRERWKRLRSEFEAS